MIIKVDDNIVLRQLMQSDSAEIFKTIDSQREYLGKWLPFVEFTKSISDTISYVDSVIKAPDEKFEFVFTIQKRNSFVNKGDKHSNIDNDPFQEYFEFAGLIGFKDTDRQNKKTEIGYWLSHSYQKHGIITKSVEKLCELAFGELSINRIQIKCAVGNTASSNIPKRLGFVFEGTEREGELLTGGVFADLEVYSKLKNDKQI